MLKFQEIKLLLTMAYYLGANFFVFIVPFAIYGAYRGNIICLILASIAIIDYVIVPLKPCPQGYWKSFSEMTNISDGIRSYFQAEVIDEANLKDIMKKNYCVCYYPHSLFAICYSLLAEHFDEKYGIEFFFTGADIIFKLPLIRRLMTWWGCTGVSASVLKRNLKAPHPHNALMLQPDGIAGMFYGLEHEQIVLDRRKGFCRIALETGCDLIPCYAFGVNDMFHRKWDHKSIAARWSRKLRTSLVFWTDRFGIPFGCMAVRTKIVVVLGRPISVSLVTNPSPKQIDELHSRFVAEIKSLFDRHKHRMGPEWARLHPKLYLETEEPQVVSSVNASKKTD